MSSESSLIRENYKQTNAQFRNNLLSLAITVGNRGLQGPSPSATGELFRNIESTFCP